MPERDGPGDPTVDPDRLRRRLGGSTATPARNPRRRLALRLTVLVVVVLVGVLAYQATRTFFALRSAESAANALQERVADQDLDGSRDAAADLAEAARSARSHSDGWLWAAATYLPVLGDDVAAVRDVSAGLDEVAQVAPAGLDLLERVQRDGLRTGDGGIDLDLVTSLKPDASRLARGAAAGAAQVDDVDPEQLVGRLAPQVADLQQQLDGLRSATAGAEVATSVLPQVLGGDGERNYLLVAQNNAEIRATGGLPGSASVISARDGRVDLGFQGDASDVNEGATRPVAAFLPGEDAVFGPKLITDFRDTNFTPDFPRAAELMAAFATRSGEDVDGVISVDPVLLAQVLRATGPVRVGPVELTGDDAVQQLLFETYQRLDDPEQQDAFFKLAARQILTAVLDADGDQVSLLRTLGEGISQRRLLFWSGDAELQDVIAATPVAGALPGDTGRPEVGLYLNDGTGAKMQYFLRSEQSIVSEGCDVEGRQVVRVRMALTNDVTVPVGRLSEYVTGNGSNAPKGDSRMQLRVFAPEGGELLGLEVDGERTRAGQADVYGRQVTQTRVQLAPGQTIEVVAQLAGKPGETGDPRLQWTPGIAWDATQATAESQCG